MLRLNVSKHGLCPGQRHRIRRSGKGKGRHDDFIARPDSRSQQPTQQGGSSGVDRHGLPPRPQLGAKFLFKLGHYTALSQHSGAQYRIHCFAFFRADNRLGCGDKFFTHIVSLLVYSLKPQTSSKVNVPSVSV